MHVEPLLAAGGLCGEATGAQLAEINRGALGAQLTVVKWKGSAANGTTARTVGDVGSFAATCRRPGQRTRVAVLDTGIDAHHPFLDVAASLSTCPEPAARPGRHGTHCAGVIASRSAERPGVAPTAQLLSVKVARTSGWLEPSWLAMGIDAALDLDPHVVSISCGINRLPPSLPDGHGWNCSRSDCLLCRAVDCAVACGVVVVAAAGNLGLSGRRFSVGDEPRGRCNELLCPGQARGAITVGALNVGWPVRRWGASSRGTTVVSGRSKPDILAPGVEVTSTVPTTDEEPGSHELGWFGAATGTSVATAAVAGAAALVIERYEAEGRSWSPQQVRRDLLERYSRPLGADSEERCLDVAALRGHELQDQRDPSWMQPSGLASPG